MNLRNETKLTVDNEILVNPFYSCFDRWKARQGNKEDKKDTEEVDPALRSNNITQNCYQHHKFPGQVMKMKALYKEILNKN